MYLTIFCSKFVVKQVFINKQYRNLVENIKQVKGLPIYISRWGMVNRNLFIYSTEQTCFVNLIKYM